MKRTIIGKKPFQHSIRGDSSFCNDILKITSPDHETVRLSWEISEAALSAAEAVLFENIRDVEKQILLFCVKNGERSARTIHTGAFKGEASVFPAAGNAFYKAEYRIYNSLNMSLAVLSSDCFYLGENGIHSNSSCFQHQDNQQDWTTQFSAYTRYSLIEGKERPR
ncbi:hypothetical protein SFC27_18890 [Bacillus licheniformis]|uniref:YqgL n=2 Tax=Bacillus licheniformis TaxID=1402 RepID=Q65HC3_BACLD|nr:MULTISPECIES: hypothetical protein [Bacillus]MBJ7883823.1 hypothetical protein [Bacillaceae bacterium HSR45]MBY8347207.1 hypothetical protein [Bacillus sp. PCH94]MDP4080311.1 hypothetical protein [Bacillota bacterium]AAU24181.1 YqgL [Bacillus licheniformis DSM 13 = ATCC 14580]AAU41541.3 YqgL [Bacillus licheniformis DSM 13 = ATCC 14580]